MVLQESGSDLNVGDYAPEFELENSKGQSVALSDLDNFDGVLVVFMCNHCPYVKTQIEELKKLDKEFSSIAIVGINSNAETHPDDSVEKMEEFIEENDLDSQNFFYLADSDQNIAKEYGAVCTPDPFLLDWRHRLFYHGRLNNKTSPDEEVTNREMKSVIKKMLKRKEPPEEQKPSQGCSIKWKED